MKLFFIFIVYFIFTSVIFAQVTVKNEIFGEHIAPQINTSQPVNAEAIQRLLQAFVDNDSNQLFSGTFVYLIEDQLQTIKVLRHINKEGHIVEKFIPLDGFQKNNIRTLENKYCLLDNGWKYQFHAMSSSFPFRVNHHFQYLQKNYEFSMLESMVSQEEVVAGNQAVRLLIKARDTYRYGYQLWFEPKTATLLKYKLVNKTGKIIEQYLFTDITLKDNIKRSKGLNNEKTSAHPKTCKQKFPELEQAFKKYFNELIIPKGYEAISFRKDFINESGHLARQFQLSDGLASVSIFIEDIDKKVKKMEGVIKLGPMSVAGKTVGQYQVTVLGAVPIESALKILEAVRHN